MELRYGDLAPESVLISAEEMMEREDFRRAVESLDEAATSENVIRTITGVVKDRIAVVEARVEGGGGGGEGGCGSGGWRWR